MPAEGLLETLGLFGLLLGLIGHLAYNIYTNNVGAVAQLRDEIEHLDDRLDGVAIIQYRHAKEIETIDEEDVREKLFNGKEVVFPSDFDDDDSDLEPDGCGGHYWIRTRDDTEDSS